MKQLGEAINDSISGSEQIAEVISRIKTDGYDIFVVLEATVGFNRREAGPRWLPPARQGEPELHISAQDARFLKSLRISVEPRIGLQDGLRTLPALVSRFAPRTSSASCATILLFVVRFAVLSTFE